MAGDLVSVIIPTYNRAYCLRRAVDSALGQTHRRVEAVVVDDGSADGTAELVASAYGDDPRVRYLPQANQGVCAARNAGMAQARGDFVAFLDSDDVWKPWKLAIQLACLRASPEAGMVWSDMEAVGPDGRVLCPKFLREMYGAYRYFPADRLFASSSPLAPLVPHLGEVVAGASYHVGDIYSAMIMGNLVHTSTVVLRRDRMDEVGGFDVGLKTSGEDYDYHLRTCRVGPVAFVDLALIEYQRGMPDQLSSYELDMARNFLTTVTRAIERDGDRIELPKRMLDGVRAEAHAWVGGLSAELGDHAGARRHLARSLAYRWDQPRTLALLALTSLPRGLGGSLWRWYRSDVLPWRKARLG